MPDGLAGALATPGLAVLAATALVAGVVYGFTGFGAALIFVPLASALVGPERAVLLMALFGLPSLAVVLPRAWSLADRRAAFVMLGAALVTLPFGLWLLVAAPEAPLRWGVCLVVAGTLAALVAGWRVEAEPSAAARLAVGAGSGLLGGATGLTGPIVVLFHLSRGQSPALTRANTILFLTLLSAAMTVGLALRGLFTVPSLWLAALLAPLYAGGTAAGQALFTPGREPLYRRAAYAVIALAVLVGLPVWH